MVLTNPPLNQNEERVIDLLYLLGNEVAELVFPYLDLELSNRLRQRLPSVQQNPPTVRRQKDVLDEYSRFFQLVKQMGSRPKFGIVQSDDEAASDTRGGAADGNGGENSLGTFTGDAYEDLNRLSIHQLAGALEQELPRTVALILKLIAPQKLAEILQLFPEPRKELIVKEFSLDPKAPEIILRRIATATVEKAKQLPLGERQQYDPVSRLVEVLRATEKSKRKEILKAIEQQNADQAALICQNLYQFEDLSTLDDSQVQKVLAKVDSSSLATALFGADQRMIDKIMLNLSKRARLTLQEELGFRKNVTSAQSRASRNLVANAIAEVEQDAE